jgi:pSer/pThr/pTyr-binding forkhead associated (FHA) protein
VNEQTLTILKGCLLALLYLFLLRVIWVVTRELRGTPGPVAAPVEAPPAPISKAPAPKRARATRLTVVEPRERRGSAYAIDGEVTIGRGAGCAIALGDDSFVSTLHARVFPRDGGTWIEDLGSTNGTTVNGALLGAPTRLERGDRIQVGGTIFEVQR